MRIRPWKLDRVRGLVGSFGLLVGLAWWGAPAPGRSASPEESDAGLEALRLGLRSGRKWDRASAVEGLAARGDPEAWSLVLKALHDRAGEVADTAQWRLADWQGADALDALTGRDGLRARDEWVRRRAAEVLGRHPGPTPVRALLRALGDRDDRVRRMALWSIERAWRAAAVRDAAETHRVADALEARLEGDRDPGNRARALWALEAVDAERARAWARELVGEAGGERRASRTPLLCAAVRLLPRLVPEGESLEPLVALVEDPRRALRVAALCALTSLQGRAALVALVDRLEVETEARLLGVIVDHLRAVSGLRYRADPRPWRLWLAPLPETWRTGDVAPLDRGRASRIGDTVAFAGLPMLSTRVAILLDFSGSMWLEGKDGRTRKDRVGERLAQMLARLPTETRFNLIPFAARPRPWQESLVPATRTSVRQALRFYERCAERGPGNLWDAFELALEDEELDTLVVLTDGVPTGGRRHRMELIVPLFLEANAGRGVHVDSILVGAPEEARDLWARLAHGTLGRSIAVEL